MTIVAICALLIFFMFPWERSKKNWPLNIRRVFSLSLKAFLHFKHCAPCLQVPICAYHTVKRSRIKKDAKPHSLTCEQSGSKADLTLRKVNTHSLNRPSDSGDKTADIFMRITVFYWKLFSLTGTLGGPGVMYFTGGCVRFRLCFTAQRLFYFPPHMTNADSLQLPMTTVTSCFLQSNFELEKSHCTFYSMLLSCHLKQLRLGLDQLVINQRKLQAVTFKLWNILCKRCSNKPQFYLLGLSILQSIFYSIQLSLFI